MSENTWGNPPASNVPSTPVVDDPEQKWIVYIDKNDEQKRVKIEDYYDALATE